LRSKRVCETAPRCRILLSLPRRFRLGVRGFSRCRGRLDQQTELQLEEIAAWAQAWTSGSHSSIGPGRPPDCGLWPGRRPGLKYTRGAVTVGAFRPDRHGRMLRVATGSPLERGPSWTNWVSVSGRCGNPRISCWRPRSREARSDGFDLVRECFGEAATPVCFCRLG
jgi:hypothetical protein